MNTQIIRKYSELDAATNGWRVNRESIAIVPTMGALHEGHLSLVRMAKYYANRVIVTIFVNPKQFNQESDLEHYPRSEAADIQVLAPLSVDAVYIPDIEEIYPPGFATTISVSGVSDGLCGSFRDGHFDGVATVVAKLFSQTRADIAVFGEKDFQQFHVVKRMVNDLSMPTIIKSAPTVREPDGLAMSSRNTILSPDQRKIAPEFYRCLHAAAKRLEDGNSVDTTIERAKREIVDAGFSSVEYVELRTDRDLRPIRKTGQPSRLLAAVWLGEVRLIDNIAVAANKVTAPNGSKKLTSRELA